MYINGSIIYQKKPHCISKYWEFKTRSHIYQPTQLLPFQKGHFFLSWQRGICDLNGMVFSTCRCIATTITAIQQNTTGNFMGIRKIVIFSGCLRNGMQMAVEIIRPAVLSHTQNLVYIISEILSQSDHFR